TLLGGDDRDTLLGGNGDDSLNGGEGVDLLLDTGGNDCLDGGPGSDFLEGDGGLDTLIVGDGADTINGSLFPTSIQFLPPYDPVSFSHTSLNSLSLPPGTDLTPPATPLPPQLLSADDTGIVGDGLTSLRRPRLVGSTEPGAMVYLLDETGSILGTAQADASGQYAVQPDAPLADGMYALQIRVRDVAGNRSGLSAPLTLIIDATPPAAPAAPQLQAADDTGVIGDSLTAVNHPGFVVTGVEAGFTVRLVRDGVTVASRVGPGLLSDPGPVPDGPHIYTALQVDAAGNISPASAPTPLVINITPPAAPAALQLQAADDTGVIGDSLTAVNHPGFVVTGVEAGFT
ncbi:MAG: hypothetical protein IRY99_28140, partial [Isosphaeraceae bacterium]|nr:hypothetical protein [Isosphaeraceae bacterium]